MKKLLIRGATLIDPSQSTEKIADLLISEGKIRKIAPEINCPDAEIINAEKLVCAPGLVDMHVHLRDPGAVYKEDIISGCSAAAAGGVTSLVCMPNTTPPIDTPQTVEYIMQKASDACARVYPAGAVTMGLLGEKRTNIPALHRAGVVALSDDGKPVTKSDFMLEAMCEASELGMRVLSHCEDMRLTGNGLINEGEISRSLGIPGVHRASEESSTARDIALAASVDAPVHICHVSTRGSVELIRDARRRGIQVTAETAPHYFTFTDESLTTLDADYRMSPPLRTQDDVNAVIDALCDGTISAIATDHAPHSPEDKSDFIKAPNGVIGMETSLAASITALVCSGRMGLCRLLSLMSTQPALILGLQAGTLCVGAPADIVIFDPAEEWTVNPDKLHGKSKNTPFKGMKLTGRVKITVMNGKIVYEDD